MLVRRQRNEKRLINLIKLLLSGYFFYMSGVYDMKLNGFLNCFKERDAKYENVIFYFNENYL